MIGYVYRYTIHLETQNHSTNLNPIFGYFPLFLVAGSAPSIMVQDANIEFTTAQRIIHWIDQTCPPSNQPGSSLISGPNQSGDSITQYQFMDGGGGNGYLQVGGVIQPDGQFVTVNASDLSNAQYVPGSGEETIYVLAYDATTNTWSNFGSVTFNPIASPTTPLSVSSISAVTVNHATQVNAGHLITITMTTSEAATVTGTPLLQLNDNEVATYTGGSGTNALTFAYTVQPGDNVADLHATGLILLSGVAIQDSSGKYLTFRARETTE